MYLKIESRCGQCE